MERDRKGFNRRELLIGGGSLVAGAVAAGFPTRLLAEDLAVLDVASAGSIRPMLEGPIKASIAQRLKLDLHSHAQGADAVAQSIVEGSLRADVFIPITAGPMLTVMRAGKATVAQPIARTEMVIVYSPKSRFAPQFEAAAQGKANWWEVLQQPGLRFARSNPAGDPGGRNIIFTMMLAAKKYHQPDLVEKVLGPTLNPAQILTGGNNQARLQSGELDASASYRIGPGWTNLPYVVLPKDINLSGLNVHAEHPDVSLSIDGKTFYPEPLVYYAGILKDAANPNGAAAFAEWLKGDEAQGLFRRYQFDPPGDASTLHA
ncbi:MAG TPA: extracellular solute-binding protein [Granulicella sp.]